MKNVTKYIALLFSVVLSLNLMAQEGDPAIDLSEDSIQHKIVGIPSAQQKLKISSGILPFERITGSVDVISGDELSDYTGIYLAEAIAARLSGLRSTYGNGSPVQESFGLSIRGNSDIEIYVDGVIANLSETPDEIDNIIVAKDYGSSFLYGSTAATGALLVNTKRGDAGKRNISFKAQSGVRTPSFVQEMMDASTYAQKYNEALIADGLSPIYSDEAIAAYTSGSDEIRYPNNKYSDLMNTPSKYYYAAGNFSGGNKIATYYSHVSLYNTNGIESVGNGSNLTRLRLKNNVGIQLGDYGKIDVGIGGSFKNSNGPSGSNNSIFNTIYSYPSNAFSYMLSDTVYGYASNYTSNPYHELTEAKVYENNQRDVYSRIGLNLDLSNITEGLSFSALYNVYIYNTFTRERNPSKDRAEAFYMQTVSGEDTTILRNYIFGADDTDWGVGSNHVLRSQYANGSLNYVKDINEDHSLYSKLFITTRVESGSNLVQENRMRHIGASFNYMAFNKYVLEANLMNVAVRQMSKEERERITYSLGFSWLANKEGFLSDISEINQLKIRANYGVQTLPINYYYMNDNLYKSSGAGTFGVTLLTSSSGGWVRSFTASPELSLPSQKYFNIGADFSLMNSSINGQLNYFKTTTENQIINPTNLFSMLSSNSAYIALINYGKESKSGIDGRISYNKSFGKLSFLLDVNALYYSDYTFESNNVNYPESDRNVNNNYGGNIIGLEANGLFQEETEPGESTPQSFGAVQAGDIKYVDSNNDGVIDEKDYHIIGHSPKLFYGLNFMLAYGDFLLSVHGDGCLGGSYIDKSSQNKGLNNYTADMANAWPVSNELPRISTLSNNNNNQTSTFWLRSASYLNLRSINLKYTLPDQISQAAHLQKAAVFASARNVLILSQNPDVYMPSRNKGRNEHPILNAFEIGIELTF